jgi:hypothetical protein
MGTCTGSRSTAVQLDYGLRSMRWANVASHDAMLPHPETMVWGNVAIVIVFFPNIVHFESRMTIPCDDSILLVGYNVSGVSHRSRPICL